jgi:hypothetical protein
MGSVRSEGLRDLGIPKQASGALSREEARDWRDDRLDQLRRLILEAGAEITETRKWRKPSNPAGVPVWEDHGIVCTGERYRDKVKLTFANGAALDDPAGLFNASLDGNARRAIDLGENDTLDPTAFKALVSAAVAYNRVTKRRP